MDYGAFPYEEPYARPRRRINYFAWTAAILFLSGFALAAWLGSFYIFDQPERPDSYRILQRLHKIDPSKRFELTAAPAGEFLKAKDLYDRYVGMGAAELAKTNAELARNYIRNYQQVRGLVPCGVGTFRLEPPLSLNLAAGWPLFKAQERATVEQREADHRAKIAVAQGSVPIPGLSPSATPSRAQNELVRVEQARPVETSALTPAPTHAEKLAKATPARKGGKLAKKQKLESPTPVSTPPQPVVAQRSAAPTSTPFIVASAQSVAPTVAPAPTVANAQPTPIASPTPVPVLPAQPVPAETPGAALASNAGGGSWKTFPPGKMPLGRLIGTGDLRDVLEHGLAGERVYLKGQFVVNFSDANRAVLRPRTKLTDKVLHFGGGSSTRIIVEYPSGYTPPQQGAGVSRDEMRH